MRPLRGSEAAATEGEPAEFGWQHAAEPVAMDLEVIQAGHESNGGWDTPREGCTDYPELP